MFQSLRKILKKQTQIKTNPRPEFNEESFLILNLDQNKHNPNTYLKNYKTII